MRRLGAWRRRGLGLVFLFGLELQHWATEHGWYWGRYPTITRRKRRLWHQIVNSYPNPPLRPYAGPLVTTDSAAGQALKVRNGMGDHEMMRQAKQILAQD